MAKKIQEDTKLIILQHGGYYENFKFEPDLISHELDIADKYISWGWKKIHNVETTNVKYPTKKQNIKDKGIINIILRTAGATLTIYPLMIFLIKMLRLILNQ